MMAASEKDRINRGEVESTEENLEQQSAVLKAVIESSEGPIFSVDSNYRYTSFNSRHVEVMKVLFGADIEIGHSILDYHTNINDRISAQMNIDRALHGESFTLEALAGDEALSRRYFEISHNPVRDWHGNVTGASIYAVDITEQMQTKEALLDSENKLANIIDFLPDATFVIDLEGKVVAWNRAMEEMTGVSKDDMIGQGDHAYTVPFYGERRLQLLDLLDKDDKEIASKYQYVQRKGDTIYAETFAPALHGGKGAYVWATASKLYGSNGDQIGAIESIRDITVQKKAEDRLAKLNECFLGFSTDAEQNINRLVALCGEQLGATCALYNRLQDGKLCSVGQWNTPPDFISEDIPDGHICYDLIRSCEREVKLIRDLPNTIYSETDPNVLRYNLKTYLGCTVFYVGTCVGSLCAVYQDDLVPSEEDRRFTEILAMAIGIEEERKRANEALQRSERSYRLLAENVTDVIWSMDMNMKFVYISPSNALMTGFSNDEFMALKLEDILTPSSLETVNRVFADEFEKEKITQNDLSRSRTIEVEEYCKDGHTIWVEIKATFLRDQEGQPIGIQGVSRDITEHKQAEEALRTSHKILDGIINAIPARVFWKDKDLVFLGCNTIFARDAGFDDSKDIVGKDDYQMVWRDQAELYRCDDRQVIESGRPKLFIEEPQTTPEGNTIVLLTSKIPLRSSEGKIIGVLGTYMDITERKQMESELRRSRDELELRVKERTEELARKNTEMERFVYTVSHDLRTPLISMSGFLGFLKADAEKGDMKRMDEDLRIVSDAVTKMDKLLLDTLELSRIGRIINPPEDVPFAEIVSEALAQSSAKMSSKNVKVTVEEDLPIVQVDRMRLVEVLVNLLENSVKYMGDQPQPEIEIGKRLDGENTVFFVRDNGIGIDPSQHDKVFELFYKVDKKSKGSGAGLAIAKKIIEVHRGQYLDRVWLRKRMHSMLYDTTCPRYN